MLELPTPQALREFIARLGNRPDIPLSRFLLEYWIETDHIARLPYLLEHTAPFLMPTDSLLDVGSFGEWPLLLWKYLGLRRLEACSLEGGYIAFGNGSLRQPSESGKEFELTIREVNVDKEPLPFEDRSFDVITCFEVLEHLRLDPVFMMKEFNRVLKADGRVILTTPNVNGYHGLLRMLNYGTPCIFSRYFPEGQGIGHTKEYSLTELKQLFANCGFEIEMLETFDYLPALELEPEFIAKYEDLKPFLKAKGWSEELAQQTFFVVARRTAPVKFRYYYPLYTITQQHQS